MKNKREANPLTILHSLARLISSIDPEEDFTIEVIKKLNRIIKMWSSGPKNDPTYTHIFDSAYRSGRSFIRKLHKLMDNLDENERKLIITLSILEYILGCLEGIKNEP
jgi:hypothetical protein